MTQILVNASDLREMARLIRSGASDLEDVSRSAPAGMPHMPPEVASYAMGRLSATSYQLRRTAFNLHVQSSDLDRRAAIAEAASRGGLAVAGLGARLSVRRSGGFLSWLHRALQGALGMFGRRPGARTPPLGVARAGYFGTPAGRLDFGTPVGQLDLGDDPGVVAGHSYELKHFDPNDISLDALSWDGVIQGHIGDCYFAAAVASIAATASGRLRLQQMITRNADGTFTVRFADGTTETVDPDFYVRDNGNTLAYGSGRDGGPSWYSVLEKAYAQRKDGYDSMDKPGWAENVFEDLLGGACIAPLTVGPRTSSKLVWETIRNNFDKGRPVTIAFGSSQDGRGLDSLPSRSGHAFSVIGYEERSTLLGLRTERWVTIRNPWGGDGKADDNLPWMSTALARYGAVPRTPDDGVYAIRVEELTKFILTVEHH